MLSPRILSNLIRYHKNKLFLGIRYGNLWGYDLLRQVANPAFVEGVTLMQQADLALASAWSGCCNRTMPLPAGLPGTTSPAPQNLRHAR
jgi:hypothetical protein